MHEHNRRVWNVSGGSRLSGTVPTHGNKNAALPALTAALLLPLDASLVLDATPRIRDVAILRDILRHLGIRSFWSGIRQLTLTRVAPPGEHPDIPAELTVLIRASITLLGPLSGMYRSFSLPKPGGDNIGGRPILAHITAMSDLGVAVTEEPGVLLCSRTTKQPIGGTVLLTEQSVTGTLMLLLYSGFLPPREPLTILDAASEPHIVTLCTILAAMGAVIEGTNSNLIRISWPNGRSAPKTPIRIDDDFMEATTYAIAAAITHSDIVIPFRYAGIHLFLIDRYLGWMGVQTRLEPDRWTITGSTSVLKIHHSLTTIKAEPWPRFPTDVMSMFVVLATQCSGTVRFVEYMYDDRFSFVQSLRDIGAHIDSIPPYAINVYGPTPLSGHEVFLRSDIRSGAAMLLAALASEGSTILHDRKNVIERGYQQLPETLAIMGAHLKSQTVPFD